MQIFASGEGRKLSAPDEFLPQGSVGKVVGLIDLGKNNRSNDFGWSGVKTVIDFEGDAYVLDFPEHTRLVTDDGLELLIRQALFVNLARAEVSKPLDGLKLNGIGTLQ